MMKARGIGSKLGMSRLLAGRAGSKIATSSSLGLYVNLKVESMNNGDFIKHIA